MAGVVALINVILWKMALTQNNTSSVGMTGGEQMRVLARLLMEHCILTDGTLTILMQIRGYIPLKIKHE